MTTFDAYRRAISYLRVSVTDRCNLRCAYCMPAQGIPLQSHQDILRYEEIETVVHAAAELGIHKVRLTGGEPLVRLGIVDLTRMLAQIPGIDDLSMTTNGVLLARYASPLADAGLKRVNVSLDTLRPERFHHITRFGELADVLAGIEAARQAGLEPIKINTVVIRDMNDDEVIDLARKTFEPGWNVRFIEWMPIGASAMEVGDWRDRMITAHEMQAQITDRLGALEPVSVEAGAGPARYYRLPGAKGTVGFITPVSDHFCHGCNRLRLTADGQLRPCLLADDEIDLRTPLRQGAGVQEIKALLAQAIVHKPLQHHLNDACESQDKVDDQGQIERRAMAQIGG
jgi:cyclic pyranopterin phosphate synthase